METKKRRLGSVVLEVAESKTTTTPKPKKKPEPIAEELPVVPMVTEPQVTAIEPLKPSHHWLRRGLISAGGLLLVIIIVWVVGNLFGMHLQLADKLIPARTSNAALQQIILNQAKAYRLEIVYPNNQSKPYSLQQMGLTANAPATITALRQKSQQLSSRLEWWHPVTATLSVSVSSTALNNFIEQSATVITQPAKDATLSITNGQVQLSDASAGKEYGLVNATHSLTTAASSLTTSALHLQTLSLDPAITDQELAASKTELENILQQHISFTIGTTVVTPKSADIANWIELTPEPKAKSFDITVNSGKVASYINSIAAAQIRPPHDQVDMTAADGSTTVLVPGANGIAIANESAVATQVAQSLIAAKGMQLSLPVAYAPFSVITAADYPKWIEVDLTNKRMYAYQQGTLVKSFLVSAGAPATPTVTGQYAIYSKYVSQNMYGENVDGSSYYQPNVPWVNYFYKDYAIHGNYWRPLSYFGNVNSSHGCVGVVPSDGEWIYDWAPIGTPVIIHT